MVSAPVDEDDGPRPEDVRRQVQRMTAGDVFATSPQLSTFLVFIVEAVLRGEGERLKGYTIGVEVLRRDPTFDPQIDPIVRVEATRLRRAIERYYAGPGAHDSVLIDLPRGGYVPRISWRAASAGAAPPPAGEIVLAPGNGMPTLLIAPFAVLGTADAPAVGAEALGGKIAEAFALFEVVNIMTTVPEGAGAAPSGRSDYRLEGTVEYRGNQVDLRFKLIDESDSTVVWSRTFENVSANDGAGERAIVTELATTIVQPFGVISSTDRAKRSAGNELDPRYQAMLDGGDALRSYDPAAHARARGRLEQLTVLDPNFANGFTLLAALYSREVMGAFMRPGDAPPLDRALRAARRGLELKPQNARGYHVLFTVLFLRGDKDAGIAAAEKAMALNPYDFLIVAEYGGRLIYCGEVDRGIAILNQAASFGAMLPTWSHFALFVGHYVGGDLVQARSHVSHLTAETYVFGQLARALIAHRDGDAAETRRAVQAIVSLEPSWREDPRAEIGRLVNAPALADRLADDLLATGYLTLVD